MASAYDQFDYLSYWEGREYEHEAEKIAIKSFLSHIKKLKTIIDIGAGYGRLTPMYLNYGKKVIITDPSKRLLDIAKAKYNKKNIKFIQSDIEGLPKKLAGQSCDVVILVRVIHHIENIDNLFKSIRKILNKNGYFILEFPNKRHLKAVVSEFLRGNLTYSLEISPKDQRCTKSINDGCLPFFNYHPDVIKEKLKNLGFDTVEIRSVSNFRNSTIKKIFPKRLCLYLEKYSQKFLAKFDFGPSLFILAQNKQ